MKYFISTLLLLIISLGLLSQNTISGFVTDESADALLGVTVQAKGTKISTMTNSEGAYSITVGPYVNTLIFSYLGMKTQEIEISGNEINVILKPKTTEISDISEEDESSKSLKGLVSKFGKISSTKKGERAKYVPSDYDRIITKDKEYSIDDGSGNNDNIKSGLLTAGEINDFGKWELWKDISDHQLKTYKKTWEIMPQERFCVQLTNYSDNPIVNAKVLLKSIKGDTIWTSLTDNTGKAELWFNIYDSLFTKDDLIIEVINNNQSFKLTKPEKFHNGINFMNIPAFCNIPNNADISFVVDATGSMGDEIEYLKVELEDILNKIKKQHKDISVRTSSVFYRDKTDSYLVKKSDFSDNIKQTINFIKEQSAKGGGDFPEAVDAGLKTAINELSWSDNSLAKVIFLILDAPPHEDSASIKEIQSLTRTAAEKGIRIIPVTASGIDKSTEYLMRSMALATNGTYVFLTDDSGIGNAHIKPTTDEFQVELLNDVFIRLINQYLTIPECEEDIVFDKNEIQDTSYIADNFDKTDTLFSNNNNGNEIEINKEPGKVKYYPNPTTDILNIEFSGEMKEMFLADVSGKILQKFDIKNENSFRISLGKYPSGIYFIQYQNGERWKTGKVILTSLY